MDLLEMRQRGKAGSRGRHPWEIARYGLVAQVVRSTLRRVEEARATVLDFGCGDGYVLKRLATEHPGVRFVGVDNALDDAAGRQVIQSSNPPNVSFCRSLDQADAGNATVNLVLMLDVVEHLEDDRSVVATVLGHRLVAPGCALIATAPAFQGLFSSHDALLGHFRRHSRASLVALFQACGLAVLESGYLFASLLAPRSVRVLLEWVRLLAPVRATGLSAWNGSERMSHWIASALLADAVACRWLAARGIILPGLSCYALCQRRT